MRVAQAPGLGQFTTLSLRLHTLISRAAVMVMGMEEVVMDMEEVEVEDKEFVLLLVI